MIIARGNELGNHSYSHKDMMFKPREYLLSEIEKTDKLLQEFGVKQDSISFSAALGSEIFSFVLFVISNAQETDYVGCGFARL